MRMMNQRGMTFFELMVAATGATLLGGTLLAFVSAMTRSYQAQMTFSQLSGYVDIATFQLKRDIWSAVQACDDASDGTAVVPCSGARVGCWLALDLPPAGWAQANDTDVCYAFDTTDSTNRKLTRRRWDASAGNWGVPWFVAQGVVAGSGNTQANTTNTALEQYVKVRLNTTRTVFGRTYTRAQPEVLYRFQLPCPGGPCP